MTTLRYWRGSSGVFGLEGALVLVFVIFAKGLRGLSPHHHAAAFHDSVIVPTRSSAGDKLVHHEFSSAYPQHGSEHCGKVWGCHAPYIE